MKRINFLVAFFYVAFFLNLASVSALAYPKANEIPNTLEMSAREAIVEVAKSQYGYTQDSLNNTVYAEWAGQSRKAWCSEFVAWCAYQAGIPSYIIPIGISSRQYINFYQPKGLFLDFTKSKSEFDEEPSETEKKNMCSTLKQGDIILIDTNKNKNDGPEHTCIYISTDSTGKIHTIDGNAGGKVDYREYTIDKIYGICKPDYKKISVRFAGLTQNAQDTKITLSWHDIPDAAKYRVQQLKDSVWTTVGYPLSSSFTHKSLTNEKPYKYRILALINNSWSEPK